MQIMLIFGGLMIGLLIFGTAFKYYEVRKAASWRSVRGKVLSSRSVARRVGTAKSKSGVGAGVDPQLRNFAEVTYEYWVNGKRHASNRVSIGENPGDDEVAETLKRYPVGARVTVFYNPSKPHEAVLERDAPEGVWRTMMILIVVLSGLLVGGTIGFERLIEALQANLVRPERAVPVAACAGLAIFMLLLGKALYRQARDAKGWATTQGVVDSARVEQVRSRQLRMSPSSCGTAIGSRRRRLFRPEVCYRYVVDHAQYQGSRISFGARVRASFDRVARRRIAPYQEGSKVVVYYNPDNPAEAVLEPRAYGIAVVWAMAAVFAVAGLWLALG